MKKSAPSRRKSSHRLPRPKPPGKTHARPTARSKAKPVTKKDVLLKSFDQLWSNLFRTPVHLDSALSKLPPSTKTILAQIVPALLLRPASLAESIGIGLAPGEPWNLDAKALAEWRPARLMAERLHELMVQGGVRPRPIAEDFPPHFIEEWESAWGKDATRELIEAMGTEPPLSLRASRSLGASSLLRELKAGGALPVRAQASDFAPLGVRLAGYAPVLGTDAYRRGDFEIQDEGSQLMSLFALWPERFAGLLRNAPGPVQAASVRTELPEDPTAWTVVDACSGAGGKALAIADALMGKGRVFAYDTAALKLQALRRRATRARLTNIQAVALKEGEESSVTQKYRKRAQVVLVDAPCSGWGVLRRNPDIKWRQSHDVLARMPAIQLRLLSEYAELVASGGRLVYGVCTFRRAETLEIVRAFTEKHPEFEPKEGGYLGPSPCDGFFMQSFSRK